MHSQDERRIEGIQRVPVEALVEVCGLHGDVPSFEAESRNVSDRGIRLRTAYLPELGAPVVCRFESAGQEVLAEGVIAWRNQQPRGGEFGVRFTALNSKSAQVLGRLCRAEPEIRGSNCADAHSTAEPYLRAGTKVKLHIDGLSSPMRARVQQGDSEQICVNSSLEFLKLGKRLQLEDVEAGDHSEAYIDGIDVVIDPETGVPNLVVVLRSHDFENTPEPSVIDTASNGDLAGGPHVRSEISSAVDDESDSAGADVADEVAAMRGKLEQSLSKVGLIIRITGTQAASIGRTLRDRGGPLMQRLARVARSGTRRGQSESNPPRRRTAPPPSQISSAMSHGLRPQGSAATNHEPAPRGKPRRSRKALVATLGAGALLVTVVAVASRGGAPSVASNSSNPLARAAASELAPNPTQAAVAASGASAVVAPVPLFGPTPMATLEPAPLGSPPAASGATSPSTVAEREMAAAKAATAQVAAGTEESSEEPSQSSEEPVTKPEDVAPWGKGKMHDPVIYRVKLDGPGDAIKGTPLGNGFSIVVPKRKAAESPKGFAKQDNRIEKVSAANGDSGVKIIWRFKDEPPGYRVRLRKNNVEFLISSKSK